MNLLRMNDSHEHKKPLRAQLRHLMRQVEPDDLRRRSADATARLVDTEAFATARTVMMFLSLPYEIDTRQLAVRAWQRGKTVTVPLVSFAQRHMIPVEIRSLTDPMTTDERGLRNPTNARPVPVDEVDLVVVPGLGFDTRGHRLGRGGGFYDRFLSQPAFGGRSCGFGFDEQVIDTVPAMSHDVPLDMLVTDRRTVRFNAAARPENA